MEFSSNVEMDVRSNFNLASQDGISDYILALSHTLGYHHVLLDVTDVTQQSALSYLTHLIIYGSTRERVLEIRASLDSMVSQSVHTDFEIVSLKDGCELVTGCKTCGSDVMCLWCEANATCESLVFANLTSCAWVEDVDSCSAFGVEYGCNGCDNTFFGRATCNVELNVCERSVAWGLVLQVILLLVFLVCVIGYCWKSVFRICGENRDVVAGQGKLRRVPMNEYEDDYEYEPSISTNSEVGLMEDEEYDRGSAEAGTDSLDLQEIELDDDYL